MKGLDTEGYAQQSAILAIKFNLYVKTLFESRFRKFKDFLNLHAQNLLNTEGYAHQTTSTFCPAFNAIFLV